MSGPADELARRTPPGQVLTRKWPVLTYGLTPRFDPRTWSFRCVGLVEEAVTFTWEELLALPRTEVTCDIHCVTHWSRLDNRFEGVAIREIMRRVRVKPEARYVLIHADPWTEERYSNQETNTMQTMRAEAARRLRAR